MTTPYILPYKAGSAGAKALAGALGCKRLKLKGSKFIHRPDRLVINWGNNDAHFLGGILVRDNPSLNGGIDPAGVPRVVRATNKLDFFDILNQNMPECIPEYTESQKIARQWCEEGRIVVCRKLLNASSGRGIVIANRPENVCQAPLYVAYVKKQDEYRVHVFAGEVIDIQRKMRKKEVPDEKVNWQVRNLEGGFIFGREGIQPPEGIDKLCIDAVEVLGLDFGAVDVIYNKHEDKLYLLEVNTAPGLEGTTLEKYTEAVRKYCDGQGADPAME